MGRELRFLEDLFPGNIDFIGDLGTDYLLVFKDISTQKSIAAAVGDGRHKLVGSTEVSNVSTTLQFGDGQTDVWLFGPASWDNVQIIGGNGDHTILVEHIAASGAQINLGSGNSVLELGTSTGDVTTSVTAQDGNIRLKANDLGVISLGQGDHVVVVDEASLIMLGHGNSYLSFKAGSDIFGTDISVGDGNHTLIGMSETSDTLTAIDFGNGVGGGGSLLQLDGAYGPINITGGTGSHTVQIEAVKQGHIALGTEPAAGATGDVVVNIAEVTSVQGVSVELGSGDHRVHIGTHAEDRSTTVTAGDGNTEVRIGAAARITLGNGNHIIDAGDVETVAVGDGNSYLTVSGSGSVTLGAGSHVVEAMDVSRITTGAGEQHIVFEAGQSPSGPTIVTQLDGDDIIVGVGTGGSVSAQINTESGDDTIVLIGDSWAGSEIRGGAGFDTLYVSEQAAGSLFTDEIENIVYLPAGLSEEEALQFAGVTGDAAASTDETVIGDDFTTGWTASNVETGTSRMLFSQDFSVGVASTTISEGMSAGSGVNGGAQLSFDIAWSNAGPSGGKNCTDLWIKYDGVGYALIRTANNGSTAKVTYYNGASGATTSLSEGGATTGTGYNTLTIDLPKGISDSGELEFIFDSSTGSGHDDISIENVVVTSSIETVPAPADEEGTAPGSVRPIEWLDLERKDFALKALPDGESPDGVDLQVVDMSGVKKKTEDAGEPVGNPGTGTDGGTGADQPADTTNTNTDINFQVIYLGASNIEIDPLEQYGTSGFSENGGLLNGTSYGGTDNPLSANVVEMMAGFGNNDGQYDGDNTRSSETFFINGTQYTFDGSAVYNNTIVTFEDGSTATVSAVVFQDTSGNLYLAPEFSNNADTSVYTSQPITNIQLGTQDTSGWFGNGLTLNRVVDSWVAKTPVVTGPGGDDTGEFDPASREDRLMEPTSDFFQRSEAYEQSFATEAFNNFYQTVQYNDFGDLAGTNQDDTIEETRGDSQIFAMGGNDLVEGSGGADRIYGGSGYDVLRGGAGQDLLDGGKGYDVLVGGEDIDIFVFRKGDGTTDILDFELSFDILDVEGFVDLTYEDLTAAGRQVGDDVFYELDDDTLILRNADLATMVEIDLCIR